MTSCGSAQNCKSTRCAGALCAGASGVKVPAASRCRLRPCVQDMVTGYNELWLDGSGLVTKKDVMNVIGHVYHKYGEMRQIIEANMLPDGCAPPQGVVRWTNALGRLKAIWRTEPITNDDMFAHIVVFALVATGKYISLQTAMDAMDADIQFDMWYRDPPSPRGPLGPPAALTVEQTVDKILDAIGGVDLTALHTLASNAQKHGLSFATHAVYEVEAVARLPYTDTDPETRPTMSQARSRMGKAYMERYCARMNDLLDKELKHDPLVPQGTVRDYLVLETALLEVFFKIRRLLMPHMGGSDEANARYHTWPWPPARPHV